MKRFCTKAESRVRKDGPVVRIAPQDDGTTNFCLWDHKLEEYKQIAPSLAIAILAQEGCMCEVAVNDPHESYSHYESRAKMKHV